MDERRQPHQEMFRQENRYVLATLNPQMIKCARYSILRARELDMPEKEEAVLDYVMSTTGLDGKGREAARDAIAGKQPQIQSTTAPPVTSTGAQW